MASEVLAPRQFERRIYPRKIIDSEVRFATEHEPDAKARVLNISEDGLYMSCRTAASVGDSIIAYPEGLGRLVGRITRKDKDGIAVQFLITQSKRAYLAKLLDAAPGEAPFLKVIERRLSNRSRLNLDAVAVVMGGGQHFDCRLVDLSETGAAVEADYFPPIGARVRIGVIHGVVSRHSKRGFAIAFSRRAA